MKTRNGAHEDTIRELRFGQDGPRVGEPLREFDGLLSGTPTFRGDVGSLLSRDKGK